VDTDDLDPVKEPTKKVDLEPMSIEELNNYIVEMETEINRVRAAIQAKQGHRSGAESLFKN
jgi:uncharacterized small protein (DUF1192 family)